MVNLPKAPGNNILGQFQDEVVESVKDTASSAMTEPRKILESILGGKPTLASEDQGEQMMEQGISSSDPQQQQTALQKQNRLVRLQAEDKQKSQALIQLHQQRLKEEQDYAAKRQQEEHMEEQKKDQEEQQKKQEEIVQLQHEQTKTAEIQKAMIGKLEGTKEAGKMQGF